MIFSVILVKYGRLTPSFDTVFAYMGSVERGERNLAAINLIRIAKTLKIEVGELFPATKSLFVE